MSGSFFINLKRVTNFTLASLFIATQALFTLVAAQTANAVELSTGNPSEECGQLLFLAKYEVDEQGSFNFTTDDVGGQDVVTFSNKVTKLDEPNEVIGFDWSSSVSVDKVVVAAGGDGFTQSGDELTTGEYPEDFIPAGGSNSAVSHVTFCYDAPVTQPETGSITIEKNAINDSDQSFHFSTIGLSTDATGFDLVDDSTTGLPSKVFNNLPANASYTISEDETDGWDFDGITCSGGTDVDKNGASVTVNLKKDENVNCKFTNREKEVPVVNYCDPTQKPGGMSIAQWLKAGNFDGADCFDYTVTERCGYLDVSLTKYPTKDNWSPYAAVYTTDGTVVYPAESFPADFAEDENNGSVDVTWYIVGPESDYLTGTSLPNLWDEKGEKVTVDTDCQEPEMGTLKVVKKVHPSKDYGRFDLHVDGELVKENAAHMDSGSVELKPGEYDVHESAGDKTNMDRYHSSYSCFVGYKRVKIGYGTAISNVPVQNDKTTICYFLNKRLPKITVVKDANPNSYQKFCFTLKPFNYRDVIGEPNYNLSNVTNLSQKPAECEGFELSDKGYYSQTSSKKSKVVYPGKYIITEEDIPHGWSLDDIECYGAREYRWGNSVKIDVNYGDDVKCVFTNNKDAKVIVKKYNDYNRNGKRDKGEPTLPDWEIKLGKETETTNKYGYAKFEDVKSNKWYYLSENQQEGWHLSDIRCEKKWLYDKEPIEEQEEQLPTAQLSAVQRDYSYNPDGEWVYVKAGKTMYCEIGNYQKPVLELTKSNNRPDATVVGDTVTYTLIATLPEESGALYNVSVTDVVPENFNYVPGSDSASQGSLTETYASPGTWTIGDMLPGQSVTMTYQAVIQENVSPGIYPDIAFAVGDEKPESESDDVYSNVHFADNPFVGTDIEVITEDEPGQVLGAVLVNTGGKLLGMQFILPLAVMGIVVAIDRRQKKGVL